jgi:hypothetical protein
VSFTKLRSPDPTREPSPHHVQPIPLGRGGTEQTRRTGHLPHPRRGACYGVVSPRRAPDGVPADIPLPARRCARLGTVLEGCTSSHRQRRFSGGTVSSSSIEVSGALRDARYTIYRPSARTESELIVMSLSPRHVLTLAVLVQDHTPARYFASRWYSLRPTRLTRRRTVSTRTSSTVRLRPTRAHHTSLPLSCACCSC